MTGCQGTLRLIGDASRQFVRATALLSAILGIVIAFQAGRIIFPAIIQLPADQWLAQFWFPLSCLFLGVALTVVALLASCSDTALFFFAGAHLFLIPFEGAIIALYLWDRSEIKRIATEDATGALRHIVKWVDVHIGLVALFVVTVLVLQACSLLFTVLSACCCPIRPAALSSSQGRHSRRSSWDRHIDSTESGSRVPLLSIHLAAGNSSDDEEYSTPRSDPPGGPTATTATADVFRKKKKSPRSYPIVHVTP